jgi:hypothetical protein
MHHCAVWNSNVLNKDYIHVLTKHSGWTFYIIIGFPVLSLNFCSTELKALLSLIPCRPPTQSRKPVHRTWARENNSMWCLASSDKLWWLDKQISEFRFQMQFCFQSAAVNLQSCWHHKGVQFPATQCFFCFKEQIMTTPLSEEPRIPLKSVMGGGGVYTCCGLNLLMGQ